MRTTALMDQPVTAPVTPADFRHVFGHLATGVTLITATVDRRPEGIVANSVTSVSLDPPMAAFAVATTSTSWPKIRRASRFSINILGACHDELCQLFMAKDPRRFEHLEDDPSWAPRLRGALATVDCRVRAEIPAGDHYLVLADVESMWAQDQSLPVPAPLLFFRGGFGSFSVHSSGS